MLAQTSMSIVETADYEKIDASCFVDTSFLIDLIGIARGSEGDLDREVRFIKARNRWNELQQTQHVCYWSPTVCQEFIYNIARIVYGAPHLQDRFGVGDIARRLREEQKPSDRHRLPPEFVRALVEKLEPFLQLLHERLRYTSDVWSVQIDGRGKRSLIDLLS
jgi:hypothetical protein